MGSLKYFSTVHRKSAWQQPLSPGTAMMWSLVATHLPCSPPCPASPQIIWITSHLWQEWNPRCVGLWANPTQPMAPWMGMGPGSLQTLKGSSPETSGSSISLLLEGAPCFATALKGQGEWGPHDVQDDSQSRPSQGDLNSVLFVNETDERPSGGLLPSSPASLGNCCPQASCQDGCPNSAV